MEAKYEKQRNAILAAAVGTALAMGLASPAWAQQAEEARVGSTPSSEAARELREAQREVKDAGEAVAEARAESREAVREGREAGSAAQEAMREEDREGMAQRTGTASSGAGMSSAGQSMDDRTDKAAAGTGERTRTASAGETQSSSQRGGAPQAVWIFVPVAVSTQTEKQSNDCWVRLYSGDNFEGRYVTIAGPAEIPQLTSPYGTGLNNWESAVVGSNATVMTYDGDNFEDRSATLRSGQRYADLGDAKLGLFEDIESIRVTCGSSQGMSSQGQGGQQSSGRNQP